MTVRYFSEALEATVDQAIFPDRRGRIRCHGVYYRAEFYDDVQEFLSVGQRVYMVAIRENIALIRS